MTRSLEPWRRRNLRWLRAGAVSAETVVADHAYTGESLFILTSDF